MRSALWSVGSSLAGAPELQGGVAWRKNTERPEDAQKQVGGSKQQPSEADPEVGIAAKAGEKEPEQMVCEQSQSSTEKVEK